MVAVTGKTQPNATQRNAKQLTATHLSNPVATREQMPAENCSAASWNATKSNPQMTQIVG
tara:strand:+ start:73 stop:252 length:180 start_codon:yes stop_codon:yes gene_type:complete